MTAPERRFGGPIRGALWGPWFAAREIAEFTADNDFEVVRVLEIADGTGLVQEAAAFRDGIS